MFHPGSYTQNQVPRRSMVHTDLSDTLLARTQPPSSLGLEAEVQAFPGPACPALAQGAIALLTYKTF